jgi:hypothetical protein
MSLGVASSAYPFDGPGGLHYLHPHFNEITAFLLKAEELGKNMGTGKPKRLKY